MSRLFRIFGVRVLLQSTRALPVVPGDLHTQTVRKPVDSSSRGPCDLWAKYTASYRRRKSPVAISQGKPPVPATVRGNGVLTEPQLHPVCTRRISGLDCRSSVQPLSVQGDGPCVSLMSKPEKKRPARDELKAERFRGLLNGRILPDCGRRSICTSPPP